MSSTCIRSLKLPNLLTRLLKVSYAIPAGSGKQITYRESKLELIAFLMKRAQTRTPYYLYYELLMNFYLT